MFFEEVKPQKCQVMESTAVVDLGFESTTNSKVHAFSKKGTFLQHLFTLTLLSFLPLVIDENGILVCRPRFCLTAQPPCTHATSYTLRIFYVPSVSS